MPFLFYYIQTVSSELKRTSYICLTCMTQCWFSTAYKRLKPVAYSEIKLKQNTETVF